MTGSLERANERYQRSWAKLGTLPDLLLSLAGIIGSFVLFIVTIIFVRDLFWFLLVLSLLGFSVSTHIAFGILPEWAPRVHKTSGGEARWATRREIRRALMGPKDNTAP